MDFTIIIALGITAFLLPIIGALYIITKNAKGDKRPEKRRVKKEGTEKPFKLGRLLDY